MPTFAGLYFDWDNSKAWTNLVKHHVTFEEAMTVFGDPQSDRFEDLDHSDTEVRYLLRGYSQQRRLLVVVYTERGSIIRIISARSATRQERRQHEQGD